MRAPPLQSLAMSIPGPHLLAISVRPTKLSTLDERIESESERYHLSGWILVWVDGNPSTRKIGMMNPLLGRCNEEMKANGWVADWQSAVGDFFALL